MAEKTGIAWTDHTFNPWWGCAKVSPACTNCYAATLDHRLGGDHWQLKGPRKTFSDKHWKEPLRWNARAAADGVRRRVFCASMADVFEDRRDLDPWRVCLWELIERTPYLDWLLLTKRPENIANMLPTIQIGGEVMPRFDNVWLGATVENMMYARERIPHLLATPAAVHFLSCEPLLGELDLSEWLRHGVEPFPGRPPIDWVITGSESGPGRRDTPVAWYRSLRDQCAATGTAFFLKQAIETDMGKCGDADNPNGDLACGQRVRYFVHGPKDSSVSCGCTVEGSEDVNGCPPIGFGERSERKPGGMIELPYLDGVQHAAFPQPRFRHVDSLGDAAQKGESR